MLSIEAWVDPEIIDTNENVNTKMHREKHYTGLDLRSTYTEFS